MVVRGSKARHVRGSTDVERPLKCSLAFVSVEGGAAHKAAVWALGRHSPRTMLRFVAVAEVHANMFAQIVPVRAAVFPDHLQGLLHNKKIRDTEPIAQLNR